MGETGFAASSLSRQAFLMELGVLRLKHTVAFVILALVLVAGSVHGDSDPLAESAFTEVEELVFTQASTEEGVKTAVGAKNGSPTHSLQGIIDDEEDANVNSL